MNYVFSLIMAALSWYLWPSGVTDIPFAQLTLKDAAGVVSSFTFGYCAVQALVTKFE